MRVATIFVLTFCFVHPLLDAGTNEQAQAAAARTATTGSSASNCVPPAAGLSTPFDPCQYLKLGRGVSGAKPVYVPNPEYTEKARKKGIEGTLLLAIAVNRSGGVDAVKILRSIDPGLDQQAIDAVKQWKFSPAEKDGEPIPFQTQVEVHFRLYPDINTIK